MFFNDQNEKLGDISEILVDKSGKVEGVVIGVGGFLGIGQNDIKVEMSKLKFVDEPVRTTSTTTTTSSTTTDTPTGQRTTTTTGAPAGDYHHALRRAEVVPRSRGFERREQRPTKGNAAVQIRLTLFSESPGRNGQGLLLVARLTTLFSSRKVETAALTAGGRRHDRHLSSYICGLLDDGSLSLDVTYYALFFAL